MILKVLCRSLGKLVSGLSIPLLGILALFRIRMGADQERKAEVPSYTRTSSCYCAHARNPVIAVVVSRCFRPPGWWVSLLTVSPFFISRSDPSLELRSQFIYRNF